VVTEKINYPHCLGFFNDVRAYALAYQLQRPRKRDSAFLCVTPGRAIIDASCQATARVITQPLPATSFSKRGS